MPLLDTFIEEMKKSAFYFDTIDRKEAKKMLLQHKEGTFLLRKGSVPDQYVLSAKIENKIINSILDFKYDFAAFLKVILVDKNLIPITHYTQKEDEENVLEFLLTERIGKYGWRYDENGFSTLGVEDKNTMTLLLKLSNMGVRLKSISSEKRNDLTYYTIPKEQIFELLKEAVNIRTILNEKIGMVGWEANDKQDLYSTNLLSQKRLNGIKQSIKTIFGLDCAILQNEKNSSSNVQFFENEKEFYIVVERDKLIKAIVEHYLNKTLHVRDRVEEPNNNKKQKIESTTQTI